MEQKTENFWLFAFFRDFFLTFRVTFDHKRELSLINETFNRSRKARKLIDNDRRRDSDFK
jgi:hypothetical protein